MPDPHAGAAGRWVRTAALPCYARRMAPSDRQLLAALSRTPFVDSTELAIMLGEPRATVHHALAGLLAEGIAGRVSHGAAHLPSSQRYHLTAKGIREAAKVLGFDTPSDFVRAYPMSREWLTLLIRRMDAVASVYRLAAAMSPGIDGLRSRVEFHRRGRFDAAITLHDGRSFGVVRQGLALRRRSLYRPAEGHRAVRPLAPSRHRADPGSQRMGAAEDGGTPSGTTARRFPGRWCLVGGRGPALASSQAIHRPPLGRCRRPEACPWSDPR